ASYHVLIRLYFLSTVIYINNLEKYFCVLKFTYIFFVIFFYFSFLTPNIHDKNLLYTSILWADINFFNNNIEQLVIEEYIYMFSFALPHKIINIYVFKNCSNNNYLCLGIQYFFYKFLSGPLNPFEQVTILKFACLMQFCLVNNNSYVFSNKNSFINNIFVSAITCFPLLLSVSILFLFLEHHAKFCKYITTTKKDLPY
ncbi:hypothetical protein ACJX0J_030065, partial [Zea mays]